MIKKMAISVFMVVVIYLAGYWAWYGYLPPQTPRKILSKQLATPLPVTWKITYFYQRWSTFLGDGILKAVIKVPPDDLAVVEKYLQGAKIFDNSSFIKEESCLVKSMIAADRDLVEFLNQKSNGLYDCKVSEHALNDERIEDGTVLDYSRVVIFDRGNERLLVYILRM